jgi:phosphoribosylformylglycinamidine synthase
VLRLKGTPLGLALATDTNPVYCALDPRRGGRQAVAEAARNLACVGAEAIGLTDCLNFGNPERPEVAWQLRECVAGMAEACRALGVPVVSGNVSLYNETEGRSIHPTPTVAMVGLIPELEPRLAARLGAGFRQAGDRVVLLGEDRLELGGSALLRLLFDTERGRPPEVRFEAEAALGGLLRCAWAAGWLSAAHDLAEGGLLLALAEATFPNGLGARLRVPRYTPPGLFSESQGRAVVTAPPAHLDTLLSAAAEASVAAEDIGEVGGDSLRVSASGAEVDLSVATIRAIWREALPRALGL